MTEIYKTPSQSVTTITELMIPSYANFGGKVHGGIILSLMDKVAYACASKVIKGIENGVDVGPPLYFSFLFGQYLSGFYADRENARKTVDHIYDICQKDPLLMAQLDSNRSFYEEQFKYVM